jgi:hypothetical protein
MHVNISDFNKLRKHIIPIAPSIRNTKHQHNHTEHKKSRNTRLAEKSKYFEGLFLIIVTPDRAIK